MGFRRNMGCDGMEKRKQTTGILHVHSLETDQVMPTNITFLKNKYALVYTEDNEGWQGTKTRMVIDVSDPEDPQLRVVRKGHIESDYAFINGKKTEGYYRLPEGDITLEVVTSELNVTVQGNSLHAVLSAWMTMQKTETIPLQIVMDLTWDADD